MSQQDSITSGFRAIRRDPAIFLLELIWRWSFGALAFLLLFLTSLTIFGSTDLARFLGAERTRDPLLIVTAILRLVRVLDRRPLFFVVALAVTLLWIILGALGRTLSLKRILNGPHLVRFRNILVLQAWRAFFLWIGVAGTTASLMFASWMVTRGEKPDHVIFYVLLLPLLTTIGIFCWVVNWYLSLAVACSHRNDTASVAVQRAMALAGSHPAAVLGISAFFVLLRVLVFLLAFVVAVFSAGLLVASPRPLFGGLTLVALLYFAWADFLYVCRLHAYVTLKSSVSQPPAEIAAVPMPEAPVTPTPNGHH